KLALAGNSTRSYDATDANGLLYQVKGRLHNEWNKSKQLGDIRYLSEPRPFDFLVAVLFSDGFPAVHRAYRIPLDVVRQFARKKGSRDVRFAQGPVLTAPGVEDITLMLRDDGGLATAATI